MSPISLKLQELLIREAHLRLSREQLVPVLADKEAELKLVTGSRPVMLSFAGREKRAAYDARLAEVRETVQLLQGGLQQLGRVEPHIHNMIRNEIEDLLRAACPEYVQALAAREQKADWRRCLQRFAERVYEFIQALGSARNMACTGYTRDTLLYSQAAVQGFVLAITAAEKVEAEVRFANKIADMQAKLFADSGFTVPPLPRLREANYAATVSGISSRGLAEAQVLFTNIIEEAKRLYEVGIAELLVQAEAADQGQGSLIENFLETAWAQLREEIAPRVNPADTERSVAESERMLIQLAKSTVLGRLTQTGRSDPARPR